MEKMTNLFWAIVWGIMFLVAIVGMFWNWAHIVTAAVSGLFCIAFFSDYQKSKNL